MGLKNKVIGLGIVGAITVGGWLGFNVTNSNLKEKYARSREPIVGEVVEEQYMDARTLLKNPKFNGLVSYSNETVKLGDSKYILKIKTDKGKLISVSVIDGGDGQKEALERLIEMGSRVSFPRGNLYAGPWGARDSHQTYFHEGTQTGTKRAGWINVLGKE